MNKFFHISVLIYSSISFFGGCTISEVSQKTKDGFAKSKSYLTDKSKKVYEVSKEKLGISENKNSSKKAMTVARKSFGKMPDGKNVSLFILTNANKMQVSLLDYGATVKEILVPDRDGKLANVSLGFSNLKDYQEKALILGVQPVGMQTELPEENLL